jgi:hypothetical protein
MIIAVLGALAALSAVLGLAVAPVNAAAAAAGSASARAGSPPSTLLLALNGVSCVTAKFCAAVGTQGHGAGLSQGDVPLTMIWNGKHWLKTAARLPQMPIRGSSTACPARPRRTAWRSAML